MILWAVLFSFLRGQTPYDSLYLKSTVYKNLTALYDLSRTDHAEVVFLGNSITYGAGSWSELLGRDRIANRGIGGDNLPGMIHRLDQVIRLHPRLCCIMAGINDLYADAPVDTVFSRYTQVIDSLRAHHIIPIIQSTLHVNPKWKRTDEKNQQVAALNTMLTKYAALHSLTFVDINRSLSVNGVLKDEYTTDGVHLTPSAYEAWRQLLEPILRSYGL